MKADSEKALFHEYERSKKRIRVQTILKDHYMLFFEEPESGALLLHSNRIHTAFTVFLSSTGEYSVVMSGHRIILRIISCLQFYRDHTLHYFL